MSGIEQGAQFLVNRDDDVQTRQFEDLQHSGGGDDQIEGSLRFPNVLQRCDEDPETGRIQEGHPAEIHDDAGARGDGRLHSVPNSGSRVSVHFTGHFNDRGPLHVSAIDPKGEWLRN